MHQPLINAQTANVGDVVEFRARGGNRKGTVLEVKGIKARIEFFVQPTKWDAEGRREQWVRFNVPVKRNAQAALKSKITRYKRDQAAAIALPGIDHEATLAYYAKRIAEFEAELAELVAKPEGE
jgi:hypothetical protein